MESTLTYRLIKNDTRYHEYCDKLEVLVFDSDKGDQDEIELLTLLIEKYEEEHYKEFHTFLITINLNTMPNHGLLK